MTESSWSIPLGRWGGVPIRAHFLFIAFALFQMFAAALGPLTGGDADLTPAATAARTSGWIALLVLAVLIHEAAHLAAARRLGIAPDPVQFWPLGNLTRPAAESPAPASSRIVVAAAGPLLSLSLALACAAFVWSRGAQPAWNPLDFDPSGVPRRDGLQVAPFTWLWWVGWFGSINWILFLANVIPALPMDGGRILRAALASPRSGAGRDSLVAPWTARTCAAVLLIVGVVRLIGVGFGRIPEGTAPAPAVAAALALIALAGIIEVFTRGEARIIEDDGFFADGVFDYDFAEGYTSLEAAPPKVRPRRESALNRWRRQRSDARRQRRQDRALAEEQRLDEILVKLHQEGRAALADEEYRFLVRMSKKLRHRRDGGPE